MQNSTLTNTLLNFNIDTSTLSVKANDYQNVSSLYNKYWDDLNAFCQEMQGVRERMVSNGYMADFSDRESELLYLMIRELAPDVVVEISPCHGYSTNYILAAMTHNRKGKLFSYEIMEEVKGRKITDVVVGNLSDHVDRSRLKLVIGDARDKNIPDCDFMFIDSCHEAYFAAWYFARLTHKPKFVMVHDVLIFNDEHEAIVPKATFLGIREQYYVLESLAINRQPCFAVADFERQMDQNLKNQLAVRRPASERSVLFPGHKQNEAANRLHAAQGTIEEIRAQIFFGDREGAFERIDQIIKGSYPLLSRLETAALLPIMGYRHPIHADMFPDIQVNYDNLTVAQLVAQLEIAQTSCDIPQVHEIARRARASRIDPVPYEFLTSGYKSMVTPSSQSKGIRQLAKRIPGVARIARLARSLTS